MTPKASARTPQGALSDMSAAWQTECSHGALPSATFTSEPLESNVVLRSPCALRDRNSWKIMKLHRKIIKFINFYRQFMKNHPTLSQIIKFYRKCLKSPNLSKNHQKLWNFIEHSWNIDVMHEYDNIHGIFHMDVIDTSIPSIPSDRIFMFLRNGGDEVGR